MFENFDIESCKIFKEAEKEKEKLNSEYVGTEHLMLALLKGRLRDFFKKFNVDYDSFYKETKLIFSLETKYNTPPFYTPLLKKIINSAVNNEKKVNEKNLLFYLLNEGEGVAIRILLSMDVDIDSMYNFLKNGSSNDINIKHGKVLNNIVNLNEKVIGREKEINLIIETILRKKKNNPLLIGESGVGKSAIVEELARRIVKGNVPDSMYDTKIVMLEMGSLLSGTRYRGDFEERINEIINSIKDKKNIVLFIDEIHTLVKAGAAEGAISASDILKPYLARGDMKCIGATTKTEYEKNFKEDKALVRRFEPILIKEPSIEETFTILKSVKEEYSSYHKVNISDDNLYAIVNLANTYFPNKKNPDKAIELLDSVMSYVKLKGNNDVINYKELELKKYESKKVSLLEQGDFKNALQTNIKENKLKKDILLLKNNNKLWVKKEDIIDELEYKNNIIINKNKIKKINLLKNKYDKKIINSIINSINGDYKPKIFIISGNYSNIINDLSSTLNYELIRVNNEDKIDKLFNIVKYNPNTIIVFNNDLSFRINKLLNTIAKDGIVEYQDEYISFNNTIIIVLKNSKSIGFNSTIISSYPVDNILLFN